MASGFTKIDLGREYAAGVNMPAGSADALKLARANAAGTNLEYVAATSAVTADGTLATALAPFLAGANLEANGSAIDFRRSAAHVDLFDDFLHVSTNGSNVLGDTPWILAGTGTPSVTQTDQGGGNLVNRVGMIELNTSAALNDTCVLHKGLDTTSDSIRLDYLAVFAAQHLTVPADATLTIGVGNTPTSATLGNDSIRFVVNNAGDVDCVRRLGGVDTDIVSVVGASSPFRLGLLKTGTTYLVYVNGTQEGSFSVISTAGGQPCMRLLSTTAATKSVSIDYIQVYSEALSRSPFA